MLKNTSPYTILILIPFYHNSEQKTIDFVYKFFNNFFAIFIEIVQLS